MKHNPNRFAHIQMKSPFVKRPVKQLLLIIGLIGCWIIFTITPTFGLPASASVTVVFFLYLVVPGWLVSRLFGCITHSFAENILIAFIISTALLIVPATVAILGSFDLQLVMQTSWLATTFLYAAVIVREGIALRRASEGKSFREVVSETANPRAKRRFAGGNGWHLTLVVFIVLVVVIVSWTKVVAFDGSFDRHFSQGFVLHFMDAQRFYDSGIRFGPQYGLLSPREMLAPWPVILAVVVKTAHADPSDSYITYIPALMIPLSFCAVYVIGKKITYSWIGGVTACVVQVLYVFTDIGNNDQVGFNFLVELVEDKFAIRFIFQLVALWLMLEYYRYGKKKWLIPLSAACVVIALTHFTGAVTFGIVAAGFGFLSIFSRPQKHQYRAILVLACLTSVMGLVPLWGRFVAQPLSSNSAFWASELDFSSGLASDEVGELRRRRLWIFSEDPPNYILSPHALRHPFMIAALLLTPLTFRYFRRSGARLLLATTIAPLLLVFTPFLVPLVGKVTTPWMLWRLLWIIQPALMIAFWTDRLAKNVRCSRKYHPGWQWIPLGLVLVLTILMSGRIVEGMAWLDERGTRIVTPDMVSLLDFFRNDIEHQSLIVAEAAILNDELPGRVGHSFGTTFRWERPPIAPRSKVERDRASLLKARFVTAEGMGFLKQYEARYPAVYVVVEREHEVATQFLHLSDTFEPVYSNATYLVFKWRSDSDPVDQDLIDANTLALHQGVVEAREIYERILEQDSNNVLALMGLAYANELQGDKPEALTFYRRALEHVPDDPWLTIRAAELSMRMAEEPTAMGDALQLFGKAIALKPSRTIMNFVTNRLAASPQMAQESPRFSELRSTIIAAFQQQSDMQPASVVKRRDLANAYLQFGQAALRMGQHDIAETMFRKAIEARKNQPDDFIVVNAYRGLVSVQQAHHDDGLSVLREATMRNRSAAWPVIEIGKIYLEGASADNTP